MRVPGLGVGSAAVAGLLLALPPAAAGRGAPAAGPAQPQVIVIGPAGRDTLPTVTPTFAIRAEGFPTDDPPLTLRLQIARDVRFEQNILVDTTVTGESAVIVLQRALESGARIFWRAVATTAQGGTVASGITGPRFVPPWLTLLSPNTPTGATVQTRRPQLVWSSPPVGTPPGPWVYDVEVFIARGGGTVISATNLTDTTFTPPVDLESNTPYRWSVRARLATGESVRVTTPATFVVVDPGAPLRTLLFQNFPNPFPTAATVSTCVWFDLREPSVVRLEIYDLRMNRVRTIVPSSRVPGGLPTGRYGRAPGDGGDSGCDERFTWDGRADDGRFVPAGVYLLRLQANRSVATRKVLFRGR